MNTQRSLMAGSLDYAPRWVWQPAPRTFYLRGGPSSATILQSVHGQRLGTIVKAGSDYGP